jgi:CIC family chloride channel protein
MQFIPNWAKPGVGGLLTGSLAVAAIYWLGTNGVTGGGYGTLAEALAGNLAIRVLIVLCILKLIATVFCYSSGGAGGIFAPALFIGGMLGGVFGYLDKMLLHHGGNEVGAFALVGMGAVFAGIIRAPITSVLIIFEMTGSYDLILPLMISNMTAYALARHFRPVPIYEALLDQDGIHLPHRRGKVSHALERLQVANAMTKDPITIDPAASVKHALEIIRSLGHSTYPVVDLRGKFLGLVSEARLRRTAAAEDGHDRPVRSLLTPCPHVFAEQPLVRAAVRMEQSNSRQLAVLDKKGSNKFVGLLTMSDIVRAHAQAALQADPHRSVSPEFTEAAELLDSKPNVS